VIDSADTAKRLKELQVLSGARQATPMKTPQQKGKKPHAKPEKKKKGGKGGKPDSKPSKKKEPIVGRTVRVRPAPEEQIQDARYRDWVNGNTRLVHEASDGQLGYLHVPDMCTMGYAEFYRYYQCEAKRAGLVLDVRWNSGGHISELLMATLQQRLLGWDIHRWGEVTHLPESLSSAARVMLINEATASDGECIAQNFQVLGLGPLVGKRTWGGTIAMDEYELADGTCVSVPMTGSYLQGEGYAMENRGAIPDHEVDFSPDEYASQQDPQLQKGIELCLARLAAGDGLAWPNPEVYTQRAPKT